MRSRLLASLAGALLGVALLAPAAHAQNALVVSVWGGNWKDTVEKVIGKAFTAKTGMPVEFEVGGTIDRLAKARVAKGNPLVDLNFMKNVRFANKRVSFGVNIYNLFNSDAATAYNGTYTRFLLPDGTWVEDDPNTTAVEVNNWRNITQIVSPRFMRFTVEVNF